MSLSALLLPVLLLSVALRPPATVLGLELVRSVRLANVSLSRVIRFTENTTLAEDIQLLDRMFNSQQQEQHKEREAEQNHGQRKEQEKHGEERGSSRLVARVLLVGDHSLFEKFILLYAGDEYSAYNGLSLYLGGLFSQLCALFARLPLSPTRGLPLRLELSGPPMIVLRPQDCPLRGPMLSVLRQRTSAHNDGRRPAMNGDNGHNNFSSSAALFVPSQTDNETEMPGALVRWDSVDGLTAVQWTHRWVQATGSLLPDREHVVVVTGLDLVSQLNDSATQGMAYVRAMCRGPDSVSVVEDVGGLGTATVTAHEMAHSLGAFHDGSGDSQNCSIRHNFLMAPVSTAHPLDPELGDTFPNTFRLSECSLHQIQDFLNSSESTCLWRRHRRIGQAVSANLADTIIGIAAKMGTQGQMGTTGAEGDWDPTAAEGGHTEMELQQAEEAAEGQPRPGERFGPTRQCQIAFGPSYGLCPRRDFLSLSADPCRRLWCKDRRAKRWGPCETKGFLPLMDGTRCEEEKWCQAGQCTARAKSRRSRLAQGQHPVCADLNPGFCLAFAGAQLRSFCPTPSFSLVCCSSCLSYRRVRVKRPPSPTGPS